MNSPYPHLSIDQPATYRITVQGWVSKSWEDWFGGLRVTPLEFAQDPRQGGASSPGPGEIQLTILTGQVEDQAALLGTLQRLYSFGLPLLSLELVLPDIAS